MLVFAATVCGVVLGDGHGGRGGVGVRADGGCSASEKSGPSHNVRVDLSMTKNLATCTRYIIERYQVYPNSLPFECTTADLYQ